MMHRVFNNEKRFERYTKDHTPAIFGEPIHRKRSASSTTSALNSGVYHNLGLAGGLNF